MSKPSTHALTVLASPELTVTTDRLKSLQDLAIAQCSAVGRMEGDAAKAGILSGLTLHRVKASLKHGEFRPWIDQMSAHVEICRTVKKSRANEYMRLATIFIERTHATKPEMLALPGDQTSLDLADNHAGKQLAEKLTKFVGELSLNELLIKHGIKGVGLKTELENAAAAETSLTPEEEAAQLEAQRASTWEETWSGLQAVRHTFSEPTKLHLITDVSKIETLKNEVVEISKLLTERLANLTARNA